MTFDEIINGHGAFKFTDLGGSTVYRSKEIAPPIHCKDGTTLSIQASRLHYCRPRTDDGPYTKVEVGYPDIDPPPSWSEYADGEYPSSVYGYVPIDLVREFIESHGGEVLA
jgi:hypothetical protein